MQVFAGYWLALGLAAAEAGHIHGHEFAAGNAGERRVAGEFDAVSALHRESVVVGLLPLRRLWLVAAYAPYEVRHCRALRIDALGTHEDVHAGVRRYHLLKAGKRGLVDVLPREERHRELAEDVAPHLFAARLARNAEFEREFVEFGIDGVDGVRPCSGTAEVFDEEGYAV